MEIDVITYLEAQLAILTEEQLQKVQEAQMKKNRLLRELAEKLQQEKRRLINNGLFLSYTWAWTRAYWEKVYEEEIGWVRDGLLFYLQYTPIEEENPPYEMDYSLSIAERAQRLKTYYMEQYNDATERYAAFKADKIAARYLCEAYKTLLDYFREMANAA